MAPPSGIQREPEHEPISDEGAPGFPAPVDAHVHAALEASARTDASLGALLRTVQHFSASVNGARDANEQLSRALERVRQTLGASEERRAIVQQQVRALEQQLERTEREASRERQFLVEQQDAFIELLCRDHDRELARRREAADELERAHIESDRLKTELRRAIAQRDEANVLAVRLASERDEALMELSRARADERASSTPRPSQGVAIGRLELESVPAPSYPPASGPVSVNGAESSSTSRRRPEPSARPLISYSLGNGEVAAERIDGVPLTPRPSDS